MTVGLSTFNRATLLRGALESLLAQSYPQVEIIVSDNASTDGTQALVESYARLHPSIRYHRSPVNCGPTNNFRRSLLMARGEMFMWASDDDLWDPGFVKSLESVLRHDERLVAVMSEVGYIDPDGRRLPAFAEGAWFRRPAAGPPNAAYVAGVIRHGYGNLFHALYRTRVLRRGPDSTVLDICRASTLNETAIYVQVAARGLITVIEDPLFFKRVPVSTYLYVARLHGIRPAVLSAPRASVRKRPIVTARVRRALGSDLRYHAEALADILRALRHTPLTRVAQTRCAVAAVGSLVLNLWRVQASHLRRPTN